MELVDIEIYLHYFMTVKEQYFFPKTNQIIRIKHSLHIIVQENQNS